MGPIETLALPRREAHLWYATHDELLDDRLLTAWWALLAPEERVRHKRLRFEHTRQQYLLTRALVRWVLSRHAAVPPEALVFGTNAWGKPEIQGPPGSPPLRFNVSRTRGMVACLVALDHDVGVDVEDTTRIQDTDDVAERFFSSAEIDTLRALPEPLRRERFFDYWTLKEAYVKGRGVGLSMPLAKVTIRLDPASDPAVVADPDADDGEPWRLGLFHPTARHRIAAAVRGEDAPRFTFVLHDGTAFASRLKPATS